MFREDKIGVRGKELVGMNRVTGKAIGPEEHIPQSIGDMLRTPKGTRVMRRDYGASYLSEDGSVRGGISSDQIAEEARALLAHYEPRILVYLVSTTMSDGALVSISVEYGDVENLDHRLNHTVAF
jgi:phage baseplate assembly protein W